MWCESHFTKRTQAQSVGFLGRSKCVLVCGFGHYTAWGCTLLDHRPAHIIDSLLAAPYNYMQFICKWITYQMIEISPETSTTEASIWFNPLVHAAISTV